MIFPLYYSGKWPDFAITGPHFDPFEQYKAEKVYRTGLLSFNMLLDAFRIYHEKIKHSQQIFLTGRIHPGLEETLPPYNNHSIQALTNERVIIKPCTPLGNDTLAPPYMAVPRDTEFFTGFVCVIDGDAALTEAWLLNGEGVVVPVNYQEYYNSV